LKREDAEKSLDGMQSESPRAPDGRLGVVSRALIALSSCPRVMDSFNLGEGASLGVESERERDFKGDFEGVRSEGGSRRMASWGSCPDPAET
jgi:hypothetical protein